MNAVFVTFIIFILHDAVTFNFNVTSCIVRSDPCWKLSTLDRELVVYFVTCH